MRLLGAIICLLLTPQAVQSGDSQCGEAQGGCADSEQVGSPAPAERSVADTELQLCSLSPRTGWFHATATAAPTLLIRGATRSAPK